MRSLWVVMKTRYIWLLTAVGITLSIELASRGDLLETLQWSLRHLPLLLLNVALVGCLLAVAVAPTGHARIAFWAVGGTALLLGAASGIKLKLLGRPLLPWDLAVAGEAADVVAWGDIISLSLILGLLCYVGLSILLSRSLPQRIHRKPRLIAAGVAVALMAVLLVTPPGAAARALQGEGTPWDQEHHVRTDGFLLALADNLRFLLSGQMDRATAEGDVTAFLHLDPTQSADVRPAPEEKRAPNVILVLSESLWDPTKLPGAQFSQDPLPFLHSLQQKYTSGWLLSPEFAGSTANVELEVLTGLSMRLMPDGVLAYEKYINRPVDSLGAIFARNGYKSTAISPWPSWFFNSKQVYRNFGFSKFISIDFLKPEYNSYNMADHEVGRNIIEESRKTPGPDFIFANTAENHYDYNPGKFKHTEITVSGVSEESRGILTEYAQGCLYADRMLQLLVEHFEQSGEPTLVVLFGDHLPLLGKNYAVYKDAGYLQENDPEFLNKLYRVPMVTWNNFLPEAKENLDFGTNQLGPYILKQAGIPGTPVTKFLEDLAVRVKAVPPRRYWEAWQIPADAMQQYEALQNDILFGEQKAYEAVRDRIIDPDYVLGYGPIKITRVDRTAGRVEGENLPPTGVVLINGQRVPTAWESYGAYTITPPAELVAEGAWTVQVKVFDLQYPDQVVAESPGTDFTE